MTFKQTLRLLFLGVCLNGVTFYIIISFLGIWAFGGMPSIFMGYGLLLILVLCLGENIAIVRGMVINPTLINYLTITLGCPVLVGIFVFGLNFTTTYSYNNRQKAIQKSINESRLTIQKSMTITGKPSFKTYRDEEVKQYNRYRFVTTVRVNFQKEFSATSMFHLFYLKFASLDGKIGMPPIKDCDVYGSDFFDMPGVDFKNMNRDIKSSPPGDYVLQFTYYYSENSYSGKSCHQEDINNLVGETLILGIERGEPITQFVIDGVQNN